MAEQTLEANYTNRTDKPLLASTDGKIHPKNPSNGYISRFPDEVTGCLGCGSTEHRFRGCPRSNEKGLKELFWYELWTHIPTTRKKPSPPFATSNRFIPPNSILFHPPLPPKPSLRNNESIPRPNSNSISWQQHHDAKRPRFPTLFARISNLSASKQKLMSFSINNSLLSVNIHLDLKMEVDNGMRMLVDTGQQ